MAKRPNIDKLRAALGQLTLSEAKQLYEELGEIVRSRARVPEASREQQSSDSKSVAVKGREIIETQCMGYRLYQLERVRCGKAGCKCAGIDGQLHGPYWYAYWRENGRLKSQYVGKRLRQIE